MILTILLLIIGLLIVLITTINLWLPKVLKMVVEKKSNFPTVVGGSKVQLTKGIVELDGVNLKNPKDQFEKDNFVTINKAVASIDYKSLKTQQIVIPELTLDLENFTCEKNKDGKINALVLVDSFTGSDSDKKEDENKKPEDETQKPEDENNKPEEETKPEGEQKEEEKQGKSFIVRKLSLRIGTVDIYNLTSEKGEIKVDLNKTMDFEDVTLEKKDEIISAILEDPELQSAGVSVAMQAALGMGTEFLNQNLKKAAEAGKKKLNEYVSPETVDAIKDAIPDDVKNSIASTLSDATAKVKQSIPSDLQSKIPDVAKDTVQKVSDAIPADAKKALSGGLKKLFG